MLGTSRALDVISALFAGDAPVDARTALGVVDAPRLDSPRSFADADGLLAAWRRAYDFDSVLLEPVAHHLAPAGEITELRATIEQAGRTFVLPIALVDDPGTSPARIRVYHSERLISGTRQRRRPIAALANGGQPTALDHFPAPVAAYMAALASGPVENVLDCLADDAVLDNGTRPVSDRRELEAVFNAMLASGGARLELVTRFDLDRAAGIEFTGLPRPVAHEAPRTPPGGGFAIYGFDTHDRIRSVRMYDDFDPDALIRSSIGT